MTGNLLFTVGAKAVHFHLMAFDQKTMTRGDLFLQLFDGFVLEFDDGVAAGTYQVVMMLTRRDMFIACLAVMQQNLACQAGLGEQLERAIHGGEADARIAGFYFKVEFFDTDMLMSGEEYIEDDVTLTGGAKTFCRRKIVEYLLFFENHSPPLTEHDFQYKEGE